MTGQKAKLFYTSLISFIFVSTSALSLVQFPYVESGTEKETAGKVYAPIPTLAENITFPILSAEAVLAVDLGSMISLYEKNPDTPLLPASTTKIVTALTAMDYYPSDMEITVGRFSVIGQKMGLFPGEKLTFTNLLYGLLVYSANDAAEVLAQNFPGGRNAFITAMNIKAKELGLTKSTFTNPTGLDGNSYIVSTARDLTRISEVAMRNPQFAKIVGTKEITVKSVDGRYAHRLVNINELLGEVDGVLGVKTGWTENARENLVTYVDRGGHKIMLAILGSQDRFGETKELIDWIFQNYKWEEVTFPPNSKP